MSELVAREKVARTGSDPGKRDVVHGRPAAKPAFESVLQLQRLAGNRVTSALLAEGRLQRRQFTEGSDKAPFQVSGDAKSQAKWVKARNLHTQAIADGTTIGKITFNQAVGAAPGTLRYERFKGKFYCGGRTYGNNDVQLPGQTTYTEWDVVEHAVPRGEFRVVIGANGKSYYTNNHYADFVELRS